MTLPGRWRRCLSRCCWAWWWRARPADVLAVVGWDGAINYHGTSAPLACVLRSWEDRFGARLVRLGFDAMDLLVERPLPSYQAALGVAAEHFAFCPDNIYQGEGSIRRYAASLSRDGDLVVLVGLKDCRIAPNIGLAPAAAMRQIKPQAVLHRSRTPGAIATQAPNPLQWSRVHPHLPPTGRPSNARWFWLVRVSGWLSPGL